MSAVRGVSVAIAAFVLCTVLARCALTSPTLSDARTAANLAADVSNLTQAPLVDAYKLEGIACVDRDAGTPAVIEATARACFARVDGQWAPIWEARRVVQTAQAALAAAIEAHGATDEPQRQLVNAWCALRTIALPKLQLPALGVCS